jgi:hypothetical protein
MPKRTASLPWTVSHVATLYAAWVVGAVLMGVAWLGVSDSVRVPTQVRWTDVGIAGLLVTAAGKEAWLIAGRRAIGAMRRAVLAASALPSPRRGTVPAPVGRDLVTASGMTRYHRADCIFAAGKRVTVVRRGAVRRRGLRPCEACLADER